MVSLSDDIQTKIKSDFGEQDKIFINKDRREILVDIDDVTPVPDTIIVEKIVPLPTGKITGWDKIKISLLKYLLKS
jgi:hypothetical protein